MGTNLKLASMASLAALVLAAGCASRAPVGLVETPAKAPERYEARARGAMVATVHPLATDAAVEAMRRGGNAVDGAVAAAVTLGVVDGHNSGIGGGCFMLVRTKDGRIYAFDGREMAPARAHRDMYLRDGKGDTELSQTGALAVGVPGSVAVYEQALKVAGKRTLADALLPAAELAERGFAINGNYAGKLRQRGTRERIARFPGTAAVLLKADGSPLVEGDVLVQKDLAATYRAIAREGTGYFYGGPFAKAVEAWMSANGGIVTARDFADYRVMRREPVTTTYRGYTIVGFPPPSSGGVHVAQILNVLERFDLAEMERRSPAERVHVTAEAMKLAFADRAHWLGDPDFVSVPKGLVDKGYAAELAAKIDVSKSSAVKSHGTPPRAESWVFEDLNGKHTTHIAVADAEGNWVAMTATVNTAFGSKVIVPGTGVVLNNQMDDFSIQPGVPNAFKLLGSENNAVAPGKRPLSSMSPTIVLKDGEPVMTVGAAGGPKIITQVLLVLSNAIDLKDEPAAALSRPRFHQQWSPDELWAENTLGEALLAALRARGHNVAAVEPVGATQAIVRTKDGTLVGVSEPRLQGKAAGLER